MIVSNRIVRRDDVRSGRLAMILRNVLRMQGGLWFGWSGAVTSEPELTVGHHARDGFDHAAVDLDPADHEALHNGFPTRVLHPLLHSRLHDMKFDRGEMAAWFRANARLAALLKTRLRAGDRIWINDLHLLPMVGELRARGVANRIGLFLHEALPACNVLASMPHHDQVFGSLAACNLIGVQTPRDLRVLRDYLADFHAAVDDRGDALRIHGRTVHLMASPVGIDVGHMAELARRADARALFRRFRDDFGSNKLLIGVDRPDPANGLCQRLHAIDHLLRQSPQLAGSFSMLQIAPPVRYDMPRCSELDGKISRHISDINGRHARPDWSPVRYVKRGFRQQVLAGYLRSADVGLMTPLHDGMTLAAKEYVACQNPSDPGVLVLSRFAGAAAELTEAIQVNPLDVGDMAAGIRAALRMPLDERQARWGALVRTLRHQDLRCWSATFLRALACSQEAGSGRVQAAVTGGTA